MTSWGLKIMWVVPDCSVSLGRRMDQLRHGGSGEVKVAISWKSESSWMTGGGGLGFKGQWYNLR